MVSLAYHVKTLGIPRAYFEELIKGVEMDLYNNRYVTFDELSLYCYRVASVVGLICQWNLTILAEDGLPYCGGVLPNLPCFGDHGLISCWANLAA